MMWAIFSVPIFICVGCECVDSQAPSVCTACVSVCAPVSLDIIAFHLLKAAFSFCSTSSYSNIQYTLTERQKWTISSITQIAQKMSHQNEFISLIGDTIPIIVKILQFKMSNKQVSICQPVLGFNSMNSIKPQDNYWLLRPNHLKMRRIPRVS